MTVEFKVFQNAKKQNHLKDNTLRELLKISIFVSNFSEAPKYSILRASTTRDFNN